MKEQNLAESLIGLPEEIVKIIKAFPLEGVDTFGLKDAEETREDLVSILIELGPAFSAMSTKELIETVFILASNQGYTGTSLPEAFDWAILTDLTSEEEVMTSKQAGVIKAILKARGETVE